MNFPAAIVACVLVAAAVVVAAADARTAPRNSSSQPNIVFIVIDDLGFDDVGFKSHQIKTPNIDQASILSGRYAMHHGIVNWIPPKDSYGLPLNHTTLPQLLKNGGYDTHAIGKWHLGFYKWDYTPTFRGFNSFLGYYSGGENYFTHKNGPAYDMHRDPLPSCGQNCSQIAFDLQGQYSTTIFSDEAVRVIDDHIGPKPLFLYLAYQAVHEPAQAPQSYIDPYTDLIPDAQRRTFAGMLSCLDEGIGNVTRALKRNGFYNNTLIVFTTDNGGPILGGDSVGARNYPMRGGKHAVYEGGVRGIAFVHPPQNTFVETGAGYHNLMHAADWLPTLCDAAGVECHTQQSLDGVSHWDAMTTNTNSTLRGDVVLGNATDLCDATNCGFAYRKGDWKFIRGTGGMPFSWSTPMNQSGGNCNLAYGQCVDGASLGRVTAATAADCCYTCTNTTKCTYSTFLANQTSNNCLLFASSTASTLDTNCISGAHDPKQVPYTTLNPLGYQLFNIAQDPNEHTDVASSHADVAKQMNSELDSILQSYVQAQNDPNCPFPTSGWPQTRYGPVMVPWC
ncbi:hypothetical protein PTSG_04073 [Salpingoeca rosetta]|uniref:Apple domain-containing protein n=1 Tax=Salpingoeca rosetta (strain ATCC 50818 / BSB-021) TaxID=946362 RepID=F2U6I3_SALR5|nr:uncharacterized protein PTSG_04073 [Salpingoeca rosetta]EGD83465.1 hypothetical protein PTSG_04073 [Salpingoeca rosetta]|eukprot:XP_004994969.1 hypothetical protein PTSG_04073 [Salpingoeca rosetta]